MFLSQWSTLLTLSFLIIFTKLFIMLIRARHLRKVMPPGPTGLPLLGNVLEMPKKETWKKLGEWNQQYGASHKPQLHAFANDLHAMLDVVMLFSLGPINSLNMAGQPIIILNTQEVVTDLLDRRSAIYADRPHFVMVNDVLCGGMNLGFMPYGDLFAASAVLRATYGWSLFDTANRDQTLEKIIAFIDVTSHASIPGNFLVNIFPSMINIPEWFPGAKWKREGMRTQRKFEGLFLELVEDVCGNKGESEAEHCLTAKLVENEKKYGLERRETAWLTGVMFAAGSGTTANTLCTFVLAMTLHPDVLQRAHAELDSVVGRNRAPTFEDKLDLPYIDAIVKEVLRWRPIAPLGIPRRCTKDDWYRGYFIPKGATIFENIWYASLEAIE
ncbi:hypothetical protein EW026_g8030 [Hermanssonia centrifuga]|uniref:Cytochrome P450 n=1 Tax=Hermanssonia centrifuga TaxID=98765 RepID=A0A4S4K5T4_9APHY|nr:hypothetical protein EW026_g8030 [Hermanssonia centrifuga]